MTCDPGQGQGMGGLFLLPIFCCSVAQLCPTLGDPMDHSAPGFSVLHCLLEFAPTHVHPSHPLAPFSSCSPSFPASRSFPVSWLFTSDGQSTGASASASVLPMNIQGCWNKSHQCKSIGGRGLPLCCVYERRRHSNARDLWALMPNMMGGMGYRCSKVSVFGVCVCVCVCFKQVQSKVPLKVLIQESLLFMSNLLI